MSKAKNLIQITLIGRLLTNPTIMEVGVNKDNKTVKVTDTNRPNLTNIKYVTNFPIRISQDFGGDVDFDVSCWGKLSGVGKILSKGRLVAITTDNIRPRIWESTDRATGEYKNGINLFINATSCVVMDSPNQNTSQNRLELPSETPDEEEISF